MDAWGSRKSLSPHGNLTPIPWLPIPSPILSSLNSYFRLNLGVFVPPFPSGLLSNRCFGGVFYPLLKMCPYVCTNSLVFISFLLLQIFIWFRISLFPFDSRSVHPVSDLRNFISANSAFPFISLLTVQKLVLTWILVL
jgi:hypothetical protein